MDTKVDQSGPLKWKPSWTKAEHELGTSGAPKRNEVETGGPKWTKMDAKVDAKVDD